MDAAQRQRRRLAIRVKDLRARRHLSQAGLAKSSGLSREYLARLETEQHNPTLPTLVKLAKGLGVTVTELLE